MNRKCACVTVFFMFAHGTAGISSARDKDPLNIDGGVKNSGIGIGGGDYVKFLTDDTKDIGHDMALFLAKWAKGEDLHED